MRQLVFHAVPNAATPLYLGEPDDMVREVANLVCDHMFGAVYFRPLDPYDNHHLPEHAAQRFSTWELNALMPRGQVVELYCQAAPLIERLHAGVSVRRTDAGWIRSATAEADALFGVVADIMAEAPVAPAGWAYLPIKASRPVTPEDLIAAGFSPPIAFSETVERRDGVPRSIIHLIDVHSAQIRTPSERTIAVYNTMGPVGRPSEAMLKAFERYSRSDQLSLSARQREHLDRMVQRLGVRAGAPMPPRASRKGGGKFYL